MPRMVGEKSSVVPIVIGGLVIVAVAAAVWYATRGSQTEEVPAGGSTSPSALRTPPGAPGAAGDNTTSDNAIGDNAAGNGADNTTSGAMGGNTASDSGMSDNAAGSNAASGTSASSSGAASDNATGSNATSGTSPAAVPSPLTSSSSGASSKEKMTRSKTIVKPDGTKVTYSKSIGGASGNSASTHGANAVSSTR